MTLAPPQDVAARVLANRRLTPEVFALTLRLPPGWGPPLPGQFVQVACPPKEAFGLRRPFSLAGFRRDDLGCEIDIVYGVVGGRTRSLAECLPGTPLEVAGPLGRPFTPFPGRQPVLVGGGRGVAPMLMLASAWRHEYPYGTLLYGARTAALLIPTEECPYTIHLATDDGTAGVHGTTVDLLELLHRRGELKPGEAAVFACGPNRMLSAVSRWAAERDYPCQVSLETLFGCGFGICAGCAVPVRQSPGDTGGDFDRYIFACKDGPVVDGTRVEWEGVEE